MYPSDRAIGRTLTTWDERQKQNSRRKALREKAVAYLGGKCSICGYVGCAAAFDFHHVEVWLKDFTISAKMSSWEKFEDDFDGEALIKPPE